MDVQVISPVGGIKLEIGNPDHGINTVGFTPIHDAPTNPHVIILARWAVYEYGKEQGLPMAFGKVDAASKQIVHDGIMYYIKLDAANTDFGVMTKYGALVLEQLGALKLIEFKPLAL